MDQLSSRDEELEIPMPINIAYGGVLHDSQSNNSNNNCTTNIEQLQHQHQHQNQELHGYDNGNIIAEPKKAVIRYRECRKNHAAKIGGKVTDGCGDFMASGGEDGSIQALTCSVCNCHRNFHRKEIQTFETECQFYPPTPHSATFNSVRDRNSNFILGNGTGLHVPISRSYQIGSHYSEGHDRGHFRHGYGGGGGVVVVMHPHSEGVNKKRFRTKFSQEQKEKMLEFAEKVGWKIQKQEENVVQQLCQEIGVKRRVLKVWMHNNKASLGNKSNNSNNNNNNNNSSSSI